jgi:hypothetical protein
MISTVQILGFLMEVQERRKGQGGAHSLFVHLESLRECMSMTFQSIVEESLGASIHGGSQQA